MVHKQYFSILALNQHGFISAVTLNPFKPEFTIVISSTTSRELLSQFSRIAVAILDLYSGWRWLEVDDKWEKV